jgi:hypothetical protein
MLNDKNDAVEAAWAMTSELAKMFLKDRSGHDGVYVTFAHNPLQAAAELSMKVSGYLIILPAFHTVDGKVQLDKLWVVDSVSFGESVCVIECDFIRYPDGTFGVLSRCKGENLEYRCIDEIQVMFRRRQRRPGRAEKMIEAGRQALAERVASAFPIAA